MILVFGRTGQVARELARLDGGFRFLDRSDADLSIPAACAEAIRASGATAVINAAAYTAVDKAEEEAKLAHQVNGAAPGAMATAAAMSGIPFVQISTDYVFGGTGDNAWKPGDPTAPLGVYGASKLAGEQAVRAAAGCHAILRTSWVFSAHGANFVKTMLRLSETHETLRIVGDQIGGPTPAAAIARACATIAAELIADPAKSGTYHFSGGPDVSWAGFAREIFRQAGRDVAVEDIPSADYPTPAARPANSRLDCATTGSVFGVRRPDWKTGLAETLKELRA